MIKLKAYNLVFVKVNNNLLIMVILEQQLIKNQNKEREIVSQKKELKLNLSVMSFWRRDILTLELKRN